MSGVVRIEALRAFEALIEARVPELAGHVCTGVAPSSEHETVPNLSIQPTKWTYEPNQAGEHTTLPGNVVVWDVGQHTCAAVLSIVAASPAQRWEIEAKVLDLFLSSVHPLTGMHRPGVIVLPVSACPQLGAWFAAFELESDEWSDTLALDRRYESRIVINLVIPALVTEAPIYTINELILGVTEDMTTVFTPATAIPPAVELVSINEAGAITRYE
ncbi:MAG TPA: hypothetical protein VMZ53_03835 [Kofleriaceae bacterium]|nr:hypothetical protein [Kofleriaceae bacterium]